MWRCCCCCCCSTIRTRRKSTFDDDTTINLLILGLNGSGKTEISYALTNERRVDISPTNGLRLFSRHLGRFSGEFTEIGGNPDIRKIWQHYYHKAFAIVYVVDLSNDEHINESYAVLSDIIRHRYVQGKPILVLANKTDLCDFPDILDFYEHFPLERLANSYQSHVLLQCCGREDYTELHSGIMWLQYQIETNYKQMKNRIRFDCLSKKKEDGQKQQQQQKSIITTKGGESMRIRTIRQLGNFLLRPLSAPTATTIATKLRAKSASSADQRGSVGVSESSWRNHLRRNNRIHSVAVNNERSEIKADKCSDCETRPEIERESR